MEIKEIIGLDLGLKRTGIARASTAARLPEPLMSVQTADTISTVKAITEGKGIEAVVVGLPRNLSGDDTQQTEWARQWVRTAKDSLNAPFYWQDEALTSRLAGTAGNGHKVKDIDAVAAAIILQDFLDTPLEKRVPC